MKTVVRKQGGGFATPLTDVDEDENEPGERRDTGLSTEEGAARSSTAESECVIFRVVHGSVAFLAEVLTNMLDFKVQGDAEAGLLFSASNGYAPDPFPEK